MSQHTKCPQCGTEITKEYYEQTVCPMCGWSSAGSATAAPPSGIVYKIRTKSLRWRIGATAAVLVSILVITPLLGLGVDQVRANMAITKARQQMDDRLYASAARTINEAPASAPLKNTTVEMDQVLSNTIRWARDISDVKVAKKSIQDVEPAAALESLEDIDEDFPQDEETDELIDLAQDQTLDPELEISEEELDEIAYVPDDPELENLDELEVTAEEHLSEAANEEVAVPTPEQPAPAEAAPEAPIDDAPIEAILEDDVPLEELPDGDEIADPVPVAGQPEPLPPKVNLYQLSWKNKPSKTTDQDSFYTINVANEVRPKKDRRSGFSGYNTDGPIGSVFKRKPKGNQNVVPLYRYWSASRTDHYYTTNKNFSSSNPKANYVRQQAAGYIGVWNGSACLEGNKPLYNIYNSKLSDNFYTADPGLKDRMIRSDGWVNPNIVGCIW